MCSGSILHSDRVCAPCCFILFSAWDADQWLEVWQLSYNHEATDLRRKTNLLKMVLQKESKSLVPCISLLSSYNSAELLLPLVPSHK